MLLSFWQVEGVPELVDGLTCYGEVAKGGYLFARNFSVSCIHGGREKTLHQT